ncbi:MAG TPA: alpha/beta hydrolase-fold protein [Opitutales bacterium]|jgi:enterochelin esterase family protein|nr:alpha/beta hydrolase-fold protein [Opitutales bacterium]
MHARLAVLFFILNTLAMGADAAPTASAPAASSSSAVAAPAPAASSASASAPAAAAAASATGARRGGGRGGAPMSDADKAEIAKLFDLPDFKSDSGEGDFQIKPPYANAPEQTPRDNVPKGKVTHFTMAAADSKYYPNTGLRGETPTRDVWVYVPSQYVPGTPAPFIVTHDAMGGRNDSQQLPTILDNLIADKRVPVMVAIMVNHGGGDGPGSERGLEYDTVSGKYAEFIENEVLPRVTKETGVTLTKDPNARATMGGSSGGAVAFSMAWFHPELYHRVITYSGTYVIQAPAPDYPHGAWEYPEHLVPNNPAKPLRIWMEVAQNDNSSTAPSSGFHNWVIANIRMAAALKAKGYHYQFVFAQGAGHVDTKVVGQTMAHAIEWAWKDYNPAAATANP